MPDKTRRKRHQGRVNAGRAPAENGPKEREGWMEQVKLDTYMYGGPGTGRACGARVSVKERGRDGTGKRAAFNLSN